MTVSVVRKIKIIRSEPSRGRRVLIEIATVMERPKSIREPKMLQSIFAYLKEWRALLSQNTSEISRPSVSCPLAIMVFVFDKVASAKITFQKLSIIAAAVATKGGWQTAQRWRSWQEQGFQDSVCIHSNPQREGWGTDFDILFSNSSPQVAPLHKYIFETDNRPHDMFSYTSSAENREHERSSVAKHYKARELYRPTVIRATIHCDILSLASRPENLV